MGFKKVIYLVFMAVLLVSCTQDLSKEEPYTKAIEKHFVIQEDLYIYQFNDSDDHPWLCPDPCKLRVGDVTHKGNFSYGLPTSVEEKYIGIKNLDLTLKGILWKGSTFTIKRIVEQKSFEDYDSYYLISPDQGSFMNQEINPYDIMEMLSNPPESDTWSDPPIFDPRYALPLPSDGIWWK